MGSGASKSKRPGPPGRGVYDDDSEDDNRYSSNKNNAKNKSKSKNKKGSVKPVRGDYSDDEDYGDDRFGRDDRRSSGRKQSRKGGQSSRRGRGGDSQSDIQYELDKIADEMFKQRPGHVENSRSYMTGHEYYEARCTARNQKDLDRWFETEKSSLMRETIDYTRDADSDSDVEVSRQNQLSEYKLKLAALVNVYMSREEELLAIKRKIDNDREEDLQFLGSMYEQVDAGNMRRPEVLDRIDEYSTSRRQKLRKNSDFIDRDNLGTFPSRKLQDKRVHYADPPPYRRN